jgi:hypothetical protein
MRIHSDRLTIEIQLPFQIPADQGDVLDATIHNALELALAPLFVRGARVRSSR